MWYLFVCLSASFVPGCYAVSVTGSLTADMREHLAGAGVQYSSRDLSVTK
jgi:hypothetical protein